MLHIRSRAMVHSRLSTTGTRMSYGITQFYLPPAITPAEARIRFAVPLKVAGRVNILRTVAGLMAVARFVPGLRAWVRKKRAYWHIERGFSHPTWVAKRDLGIRDGLICLPWVPSELRYFFSLLLHTVSSQKRQLLFEKVRFHHPLKASHHINCCPISFDIYYLLIMWQNPARHIKWKFSLMDGPAARI